MEDSNVFPADIAEGIARRLSDALSRRLTFVLLIAVLGTIGGAVLWLTSARIYRAEVMIVPQTSSSSDGLLGGILGNIGGISALAGASVVGGGVESANASVTLEVLRSKSLARRFVVSNRIAPLLLSESKWRSFQAPPTARGGETADVDRAVRRFHDEVSSIAEDRRSGVVTVGIEWVNPEIAASWANGLVATLNAEMRSRAKQEAERNLVYLTQRAAQTPEVPVREAVYRLMEAEVKAVMLADVRADYAYKVLDPAVAPDRRDFVSPNLLLLIGGGTATGLLLGLLIAWLRA